MGMGKSKTPIFVSILFFLAGTVFSQSSDSTGRVGDRYIIQVNNLAFPIKSNGALSDFSYANLNGDMVLFSAGFFLAGKTGNNIWASIESPSMLEEDYVPGAINDSLNLSKGIFVIRRSDPPFGKSWQEWKDAVKFGAKFYDGDGDGKYNPVDKNLDSLWNDNEDMPYLLGNITTWCVYNDSGYHHLGWNPSEPSGIEIRQTVFAGNEIFLQNTIYVIYSIVNRGIVSDSLPNVYFAVWADPEIGEWNDDLSGCDTTFSTGFAYNNGSDLQLGNNPPAVFFTILQGPVVEDSSGVSGTSRGRNNFGQNYGQYLYDGKTNLRTAAFQKHVNIAILGWLESPYSVYRQMRGLHPYEGQFDPCTFGEGVVVPDSICNLVNPAFMFSGDPVAGTGWLDTFAYDQRVLLSTGPFDLVKDKPQNIIIAYTAMRGNDALDAVRRGKMLVSEVIREYDSNFVSLTYEAAPSSPPPSNQLTYYKLYQNYPNPLNPSTNIKYSVPQKSQVQIKVFDVLGNEIETIVNEQKPIGTYEITWDAANLPSGVYFYQLKAGDFIQTKKMVLLR